MDKRIEENLSAIEDKIDSLTELLVKMAESMIERKPVEGEVIEDWKQRCRARAAQRRRRSR